MSAKRFESFCCELEFHTFFGGLEFAAFSTLYRPEVSTIPSTV